MVRRSASGVTVDSLPGAALSDGGQRLQLLQPSEQEVLAFARGRNLSAIRIQPSAENLACSQALARRRHDSGA